MVVTTARSTAKVLRDLLQLTLAGDRTEERTTYLLLRKKDNRS